MELSKLTLDIFSKLEHKWLSSRRDTTHKTRILSIDGGGTTAVVAGAALLHLEHQIYLQIRPPTHAHITNFFYLIVRIGVGAILATIITPTTAPTAPSIPPPFPSITA